MTHHVKMGRTVHQKWNVSHTSYVHTTGHKVGGVVWLMAVRPPLDMEILPSIVRRLAFENLASSSEEAGEDKGGGWGCGEEWN